MIYAYCASSVCRCLWAWGQGVCASCLQRLRRRHLASSSSMRLMLLEVRDLTPCHLAVRVYLGRSDSSQPSPFNLHGRQSQPKRPAIHADDPQSASCRARWLQGVLKLLLLIAQGHCAFCSCARGSQLACELGLWLSCQPKVALLQLTHVVPAVLCSLIYKHHMLCHTSY